MTPNNDTQYSLGDWLVHCHHGVGRIEALETKRIGDQENMYYRFKTANSVIWMPVDQMSDDLIRPIMDITSFQEAVEILEKPAKAMATNMNTRKARIKAVTLNNMPEETARLIRDLHARRRSKGVLSQTGRQALRDLTERFVHEWAVCSRVTVGQARRKLNRKLRKRRIQAEDGGQTGSKKEKDSSMLDALIKNDERWAKWLNQQIRAG